MWHRFLAQQSLQLVLQYDQISNSCVLCAHSFIPVLEKSAMQSSLELDYKDVKFDLKEYYLYLIPKY